MQPTTCHHQRTATHGVTLGLRNGSIWCSTQLFRPRLSDCSRGDCRTLTAFPVARPDWPSSIRSYGGHLKYSTPGLLQLAIKISPHHLENKRGRPPAPLAAAPATQTACYSYFLRQYSRVIRQNLTIFSSEKAHRLWLVSEKIEIDG